VTFVVSQHERALLLNDLPHANIELLSNIHEVHGCRQPHEARKDFIFIGGIGHPPNADAVRWIARDILPALRRQLPDTRIHILGDVTDAARDELRAPGLELHGRVHDLAPWLDSALASLAPLRFGAGVKGKINMAMSYGVPVIATSLAVEGMHLQQGQDVLLADTAEDFARAARELQQDGELWKRLSAASLDNVKRHFSPCLAYKALERALGPAPH
jgi:glycosyltransferase involved in cell wall biosynthesis